MPSADAPEVIVARWLRQNHYEKTLSSFLEEAGLPPDAGSVSGDALTLEQVLEEKRLYDQSLAYEKRSVPGNEAWSSPFPSEPRILDVPQAANILHVDVSSVERAGLPREHRLSVTMADRRMLEVDALGAMEDFEHMLTQDSPILSWMSVGNSQYIGTTMSGKVFIYKHGDDRPSLVRTDHKRYCIKAALSTAGSDWYLATIGWDSRLNIYHINPDATSSLGTLDAPISTLDLPSIPEDILWINNPYKDTTDSDEKPILILTRRDSCLLHYYTPTEGSPTLLGTQNLAPHAISWTIFTPSSIALCPTDPTLLAVATSSLPHLKLVLLRIRIPKPKDTNREEQSNPRDPREALSRANEDESAILHHVSTLAPQTPYSTPKVVWRPDGSGVWVNGDDGCVRGIERSTGKVVATLKGGHEVATKVRTLWAGIIEPGNGADPQEWVVSGGFDRRVVVWRIASQR